ncbi:TlpA family protein disulfide reductase [Spirosoma pollinicola]|uniref:DUF5106 domain-containing protein n=1 Tax=Spirosoma pollinicola TaxID=2057025 RepID=A0A2K8Z2N2_9BACT|nr:TlpA family protein disulfide reductase [Spirosoma pollinicola]AUD04089.1 DUF5106 domain-containing protein [Spirosoma pollinicola]
MTSLFKLILVLTLCANATAQTKSGSSTNGFKVEGYINGMRDSTLVLAHWYGATSFIPKDTVLVNAQGYFSFEGDKPLPQGLYLVVPPSKRDIGLHLIITEQQRFSFKTDTANLIKNMKVSQSKENELFYAYQQQLGQFNEEAKTISLKNKAASPSADNTTAKDGLAELTKRAKAYQAQFMKEHKGSFAVELFKATAEPTLPTAPMAANGRADSNWVFNYYKAHYWDGYNWTDERLIRTPVLQTKLNRYIQELTVQNVDSLVKEADWLVGKAKASEVKTYIIWYITSQYERPKVIGTDGVFIHMAEKYWLTGVYPVSDPATLKTMRERVAILKPLQVGKAFPFFKASDTLQHPISLQSLKADYTVIFFYAPHCGHCRDTAPKLKQLADRYFNEGVRVAAIAVDDSEADWKKFIREFRLTNFIHGYDLTHTLSFQRVYDVAMTPTIYILDKDKRIIARQLPFEQVEDFILFHQRQQVGASSSKKVMPGKL